MSPWLWLLVPLLVTAAAAAVLGWRSRPRGPGEPVATITAHERFREALADGGRPVVPQTVTVLTGPPDRRGTAR